MGSFASAIPCEMYVRRCSIFAAPDCCLRPLRSHRASAATRLQKHGVCSANDSSGAVLRRSATAAEERFTGREDNSGATARFAASNSHSEYISLHYATGWSTPTIVYSLSGGEWQRRPLEPVISSGGSLSSVRFEVPASQSHNTSGEPVLEFVLTDGRNWDKRGDGSNYVIRGAGAFMLKDGEVARVLGRRVLLISDLDDTMIGDDKGTAAFKRYWQREAIPRGSRLVYNTGRALAKCQELFEEKADVLPLPDFLITSVGTKVYRNEGGTWVEDDRHSATLDRGWDLDVVRDAAYSALAKVGRERMHFRPPEEQNDHKVTCGVREAVVGKVEAHMKATLDRADVSAKLIVSGTQGWRHLDIVSNQAGKLSAMEFIRSGLGFGHSATVACGDSGNDIAMMEGRNLGVIVGNAQRELLEWLVERRQDCDLDRRRLLLSDGKCAHGILEGLAHFGFLT